MLVCSLHLPLHFSLTFLSTTLYFSPISPQTDVHMYRGLQIWEDPEYYRHEVLNFVYAFLHESVFSHYHSWPFPSHFSAPLVYIQAFVSFCSCVSVTESYPSSSLECLDWHILGLFPVNPFFGWSSYVDNNLTSHVIFSFFMFKLSHYKPDWCCQDLIFVSIIFNSNVFWVVIILLCFGYPTCYIFCCPLLGDCLFQSLLGCPLHGCTCIHLRCIVALLMLTGIVPYLHFH